MTEIAPRAPVLIKSEEGSRETASFVPLLQLLILEKETNWSSSHDDLGGSWHFFEQYKGMDACDKSYKSRNRRERENPSFSSTLLDAIYRSIDEGHGHEGEEELVLYRETMRKKQSNYDGGFEGEGEDVTNHRRACLIEKWMEKKVTEKVVVRTKSAAEFVRNSRNDRRDSTFVNSSSSSSDSSCGGMFSSSELEPGYNMPRPKPIRTSVSVQPEKFDKLEKVHVPSHHHHHQKPKEGGGFVKTKSKALKQIYGDLKKVKQPISPGGKLATFLNSLFAAGNTKKAKISTAGGYNDNNIDLKSKSSQASTCSSASSFSRSCLSKTPSSRGNLSNNGTKRSVKFDPVSVIVYEDCQPCGHKSFQRNEPSLQPTKHTARNSVHYELNKFHITEKSRRVEEAARDLLRNYQRKVECETNTRNARHIDADEEEDEDEDAASCASSDLFELDNLSAIGIERYREELPVYETTHFDTNRAIANGFIL
ncbi:hypothetical protein RJ640_008441 [Escallonia rubra]|uniref:Protein BIG GRAIN 1-like B n=1 Tax=Escallonia rubra TaxID=112253 RepID=A0AA88QMG5_9ASTE|nr:hypothetical protein RJ640_008441 [Escallonia rubra]